MKTSDGIIEVFRKINVSSRISVIHILRTSYVTLASLFIYQTIHFVNKKLDGRDDCIVI